MLQHRCLYLFLLYIWKLRFLRASGPPSTRVRVRVPAQRRACYRSINVSSSYLLISALGWLGAEVPLLLPGNEDTKALPDGGVGTEAICSSYIASNTVTNERQIYNA